MNAQAKQSAIARLLAMLRQSPDHDYRPPSEVFADLDTDRIAAELQLVKQGTARGTANRPAQTAQTFDDVEHQIIERAESHKQAAQELYLRHLETYDERLTALNFEERFAIIQQAAPAAVGEFRAEAALGRDELFRLRRRVLDCEEERDDFKKRHRLNRPARLSSSDKVALKVGILAVLFVIEVAINGGFLAKANEQGYLGGAVQAVSFAALNIIMSFLWGLVPIRLLNRRFGFLKVVGFVSLIAYLGFAAGLNLTLSHLREIPPSLTEDVGHQVLVRLQTAPFLLNDINSWVFFGIGFSFSLIAMADGVLFTDPFFGYAPVERRCVAAHVHYTDGKDELVGRLKEIRDAASKVMNDAARDLSLRRGEYDAILQARSRLSQRFAEHQNHIERACRALLSVYREANHAARKTAEPDYWSRPYKLERIPATGGEPDGSAREELRRSIHEAQEVLKAQTKAVHEAFEEAVRSYKEIDDMIPEKNTDAAKQKAA